MEKKTYNICDYWPNPGPGEKQVVQDVWRAPDGSEVLTKKAEYFWSGTVGKHPVIRLDEYNEGKGWTDVWEVRRWHAMALGVIQIDYRDSKAKTWGRHYAKSIDIKEK